MDIERALAAFRRGGEAGVKAGGEHLLEASNRRVPKRKGALEESGKVEVAEMTAEVRYTDPVAIIEHEDMRVHHGGDRSAKFLEKAMTEEKDTIAQIVAEEMRQAISSGGASGAPAAKATSGRIAYLTEDGRTIYATPNQIAAYEKRRQ